MSGTNAGETPGWVAGYVPPADEWNSWWSRKVDVSNVLFTGAPFLSLSGGFMTGQLTLAAAPTLPLHAATKAYADTKFGPAGGTITGDLHVNGGLYAGTAFGINKYNNYEWNMGVSDIGDHIQSHRVGYYDYWKSADGTRGWVNNNVGVMSLDPAGDLTLAGGLSATGSLSATGNLNVADIDASGNVFANQLVAANGIFGKALGVGQWVFYNNGNLIQEFTPDWYDKWTIASGDRDWVNKGVSVLTLSGGGNMSLHHGGFDAVDISATNTVSGGTGVYSNNRLMFFGPAGLGTLVLMSPSWYWEWTTADGDMSWVGPLPGQAVFFQMRTADKQCVNYLGPFAGLGAYVTNSDIRMKTDVTPAACGLAEVLKLEPIEFERLGREGPREIGFSAQQVRDVIPLAVRHFDRLDTDDPSLGLTMDPVIVALVNGMKELAGEVAALKAAR